MNNIYVKKWNVLDSIIYKAENCISKLKNDIADSRAATPDPEEIIEAATEQLQHENQQLKKRMYPKYIIVEDEHYFCPDCHEELDAKLIKKKFCPECGKRIVLNKLSGGNDTWR